MWTRIASLILSIAGWTAFFLSVSLAAPTPSSIASSDPQTIALGLHLFGQNCAPCHGKKAVGENPASPMGGWITGRGDLAPALNGTGHSWHHPPEYFFRIIREGSALKFKEGSALKGSRMKGWAGRMTDYEILAVIAYFQSLWPEHIKNGYRQRYLHQVWD